MNKVLKVLALVMLAVTLAGACVVLYGVNTLAPQVVQIQTSLTPAAQAQETFDAVIDQVSDQLFDGRIFVQPSGLRAEDCTFVTYTVRLQNKGFFPAEWISLSVTPVQTAQGADVLELGGESANVLTAGAQGDIAVTILTTITEAQQPRDVVIDCYVLGRKTTVTVRAN